MRVQFALAAVSAIALAACAGGPNNQTIPTSSYGVAPAMSGDATRRPHDDMTSLLKTLTKQAVIGSTVDPKNGDVNPYGLTVVPANPPPGLQSPLKKGDLLACNFNNKANVQGTGTTIVHLKPAVGTATKHFAQTSSILGCAALVVNTYQETFATGALAKQIGSFESSGQFYKAIKNAGITEPWGIAYTSSPILYIPDTVWVSDASNGSIFRIDLNTQTPTFPITKVVTGFAINHGKPGSILGPSGLQYDASIDTLYVTDGVTNTVVAIAHAWRDLKKPGVIVVGASGKTFSGAKAPDARLVFAGKPLNGPISAALLPNHNLILGNTLDPNGINLLVELTPHGKLLATRNVDKGAQGALFGIASSIGTTDAATQIYFNDDNANNVQVLEQ